ncbi:amino acid adenylation domain-containing protein [Streptomyces sp. NBC_01716]|uniref:amino acid adenylation domain-containing protein n=1 Tax=Streptomyces sp. NBC_01716 TaxID=2975917 RepID=UPI002E2FA0D4|nr:amino acid adenylation domain-containing protein [Streptomyces sp. NBC_01716]
MSHTTPAPSTPDARLIHEAVARQAGLRPDATALVFGGRRVSYRTLDLAAEAYAAELGRLGVGPGRPVPVLLPRSPQLVAVLLAVLKRGAAYAALDPKLPADRLRTVLGMLAPPVVVAPSPGGHALPAVDDDGRTVWQPPAEELTEAAERAPAARHPPHAPDSVDASDAADDGAAPATVFFTSGTTGTPKGVLSPHRATTRLFGPDSFADFGPGRVMSQAAPVSWDALTLELWSMLTTGGTVVLVDGDYFLPDDLAELVESTGLDTIWLTAALFNLFVDEDPDCFTGLRQVFTGGERLSAPHVRAFLARHPGITLVNGYGPVECCVFVTTHRIRPADCEAEYGIPLGTAVPGTAIHVLDGDREVPPGALGEICVSGDGLADGYLGNERATRESFTTFDPGTGPRRIYRTGDLGRLDGDGVLHFHGRADRQIKISGHRVEPAETEAAALRLPGIRECAVVPVAGRSGAYERLAMFYTEEPYGGTGAKGDAGTAVDSSDAEPEAVRKALAAVLPRAQVPDEVRRIGSFPRTPNGKIDIAALLDPPG